MDYHHRGKGVHRKGVVMVYGPRVCRARVHGRGAVLACPVRRRRPCKVVRVLSPCVYEQCVVSVCDLDGDRRTFTSPPPRGRQDRLHRPPIILL